MANRVTVLDAEHDAAMVQHACDWAAGSLQACPVDWVQWQTGARACYAYAGVRWPTLVAQVSSPLALARVLMHSRVQEVPGDEDRAVVDAAPRWTLGVDVACVRDVSPHGVRRCRRPRLA